MSGEHALIWWDGSKWSVRDLSSRNGTRVDGELLESPCGLELDCTLQFGAHPLEWVVESLAPPRAKAVRLDPSGGEIEADEIVAEEGILTLCADQSALAVLYGDSRSSWTLELGDDARPVSDGEEIQVGGVRYRLHLPQLLTETTPVLDAPPTLEELTLQFRVSRDEEHVSVSAQGRTGTIDLGTRAHHYTLLTLARARLRDAALPTSEQGWMYREEICEQLRVDREQLNMFVFRARKQVAEAGLVDARRFVERRPDTAQLRLGVGAIEITQS